MKFTSALPALFASLLLASPAQAAHGHEPAPGRVEFQAEASRVLPNDLLRATLHTELGEKDPARLSRALTAAMNNALKAARDWPTVKVATGNQSSWPVYGKQNRLEGWRGRAELTLESRDFKAAGELLAELQDNLQLQSLNFVVAEETRQAAEQELTREAIKAFRDKARLVSDSWGAKGYELLQMNIGSTGGHYPRPPMVMMMAKMADAAPAQEMAGGESRLGISVNGSIQLVQP